MKSSITDSPRDVSNGEKDNFGIERFELGLTNFINNSSTPITIALQGEWGSGKTSLMNGLKRNLSDLDDSNFHAVWLNTWEYSLMKDAQSTLVDIISGLIEETSAIAQIDEAKTKKILNTLWAGVKDTSKVVAKNALDNQISGAGNLVDAFSSSTKSSISKVRQDLEDVIQVCIEKHNKSGFIFFIDDLDRIDPPVAVQLLELLKNIFTLKNCVFILAIDYDVVVKGLEPKFGRLSETNEREFRSFFDKIIQVPFSMPVSTYVTDNFLKESLLSINYITQETADNFEIISQFSEIANLSVGKNPRALKRLMNSLSLISFINHTNNQSEASTRLNTDLELLVNFALVSIQIAYPNVYRLLSQHPGFDEWDESIALQMNLEPLEPEQVKKLKVSEEFDEDWEIMLFRLCEKDHYLKKRALNISRLLNIIKKIILDKNEDIENVIESIVSLSSVTSVDADTQVVNKRSSFSLEESNYDDERLAIEIEKSLTRESNLTPRLIEFLKILLQERRSFDREDIKAALFNRGIGDNIGQTGRYLSNISQFITKKSNPHFRQIISFQGDLGSGMAKNSYTIHEKYVDLVTSVIRKVEQN